MGKGAVLWQFDKKSNKEEAFVIKWMKSMKCLVNRPLSIIKRWKYVNTFYKFKRFN